MRVRRHTAAMMITSALFAAGVVAPADAKPAHGDGNGHDKGHCRAFHARGVGVDDGMGTTTATIYRGNREIGTTVGSFTVTSIDSDGVASFTGTIVFTNDRGTLTAPVVGTLDTVSGEFVSRSDSVTGDGRLRRGHRSAAVRRRRGPGRADVHRDGAGQALRAEEEQAALTHGQSVGPDGYFVDAQRALRLVTGRAPSLGA